MAARLPLDVRLVRAIEPLIFARRPFTLALLALLTVLLGWQATRLTVTAADDREHVASTVIQDGADADPADPADAPGRIRIALSTRGNDLYTAGFLFRLKTLTEAVGAMPGIDPASVRSLFSPALRYVEVVEGAYRGASVIPEDFVPTAATPPQLAKIRASVIDAELIGQYVSADQRSALIEARARAGATAAERRQLARRLDAAARAVIGSAGSDFSVAVSGGPALAVALEAGLPALARPAAIGAAVMTIVLMTLLGSPTLGLLVSAGALVAVTWQLGLLTLVGAALDPQAIGVVLVTLAAAVLQGAQVAVGWRREAAGGHRSGFEASLQSWRRLAIPAASALLATAAAVFALAVIAKLPLLRQTALAVALGLVAVLIVNGSLLPLLLSRIGTTGPARSASGGRDLLAPLVAIGGAVTGWVPAIGVLIVAAMIFGGSAWQSRELPAGLAADRAGFPSASRYPADAAAIARQFPRSAHRLTVRVSTSPDSCTRAETLEQVDRLAWQLANVPGVTGTASLPQATRRVLTAFSEGSPKFRVLARNRETLTQAIAPIPVENRLFNGDCSELPIQLFLNDERPVTLAALAERVTAFNGSNAAEFYDIHKNVDAAYCALQRKARIDPGSLTKAQARLDLGLACPVQAELAGGPAGQRLAAREALADVSVQALIGLLAVLALAVWWLLGDAASVIAILVPTVLATVVMQALMSLLGLPITAVELPQLVALLGVSLVANLLLFSDLRQSMAGGVAVALAWTRALDGAGRAVLAASLALMAGGLAGLAATGDGRQAVLLMIAAVAVHGLCSWLLLPAIGRFLLTERKPEIVVPRY